MEQCSSIVNNEAVRTYQQTDKPHSHSFLCLEVNLSYTRDTNTQNNDWIRILGGLILTQRPASLPEFESQVAVTGILR